MSIIRPRERAAIIQSLRAGVTPRTGLEHIQVGRIKEVKSLIEDLDNISAGGSAFRLIIGDYGSGKSFFLQLIRYIALEKNLVVMNADLSPVRRLFSSGGEARGLYQELTQNLATRAHPEGNAIVAVVEKFITEQIRRAKATGATEQEMIETRLQPLSEMVGGYDFSTVILRYYEGYNSGNDELKNNAVRYLRGEYRTRTDAKTDLKIRSIVTDKNIYDQIKLLARFVHLAGFKGLLVNLDEMVNLYKLHTAATRSANYEQILRILNDCLQGNVQYLGFLMGGTPEFMNDTQKGLFSYEALRTRLAENTFSDISGLVDYRNPVVKMQNLTPEEIFVLLSNIRNVFAGGKPEDYLVPDEALKAFLQYCSNKIGDAYFRTPRNTIKAFVDMLSLLEQNPQLEWSSLLGNIKIRKETPESLVTLPDADADGDDDNEDDDSLVGFKLN